MSRDIKKGFSLIMGIFFIVLVATLGMMALQFSTQSAKQSVDVYLREQAELYAMSATELTVMAMQLNDYNAGCLQNPMIYAFNDFTATVNVFYLDAANNQCANRAGTASAFSVQNPGSFDNVALLDVVVTTNPGITTEPIRFHRRTVQRP